MRQVSSTSPGPAESGQAGAWARALGPPPTVRVWAGAPRWPVTRPAPSLQIPHKTNSQAELLCMAPPACHPQEGSWESQEQAPTCPATSPAGNAQIKAQR